MLNYQGSSYRESTVIVLNILSFNLPVINYLFFMIEILKYFKSGHFYLYPHTMKNND